MTDPTFAERLTETRAQLDALACALAHVDLEAIEASAQALAHLVAGLPAVATAAGSSATDLDPEALAGLRWQLLRCRRLGATPSTLPLVGGGVLYRPDGHTRESHGVRPSLEVAG